MTVEFDPYDFKLAEEPYGVYRALRDERPVYFNSLRGCWALSRYEDVQAAARDSATFSNEPGVELDEMIEAFGKGDFLNMDPPRHDVLRNLLRDRFTPKSIAQLEPTVRGIASGLIDAMRGRSNLDLAAEFAWPLSIATISHVLGIPEGEAPTLMRWLHALGAREPGAQSIPPEVVEVSAQIRNYLVALVDERERHPREDVLTLIAGARSDGTIEPEETAGLAFLIIVAGTDTTASLISNSFLALNSHRDQLQLLARRQVETPTAVEELLRYDSPVQLLARTTTGETRIRGQVIPARARVLLLWGSANRDERRFENADSLDLTRTPKRHLAFGEGIHFCLGAALARLEARIAFEEFFPRVEYEVTGPPEWIREPTNKGLIKLPAVGRVIA